MSTVAICPHDLAAIKAAARRDAARAQGRVLSVVQIGVLRRTVFAPRPVAANEPGLGACSSPSDQERDSI